MMAIDSNDIDIRSPAERSMSSSRAWGTGEISRACSMSWSVVWPMAETTTTTGWPFSAVATMRRATLRIRSGLATDVPPYFWTTIPMMVRV